MAERRQLFFQIERLDAAVDGLSGLRGFVGYACENLIGHAEFE